MVPAPLRDPRSESRSPGSRADREWPRGRPGLERVHDNFASRNLDLICCTVKK